MIVYDIESMRFSGESPVVFCELPGTDEQGEAVSLSICAVDEQRGREIAATILHSAALLASQLDTSTTNPLASLIGGHDSY